MKFKNMSSYNSTTQITHAKGPTWGSGKSKTYKRSHKKNISKKRKYKNTLKKNKTHIKAKVRKPVTKWK